MKPHKWAAEIKAWADGAEIQFRHDPSEKWQDYDPAWKNIITPSWHKGGLEFRVKPEKKEPGEVLVENIWKDNTWASLGDKSKKDYNAAAQAIINAYKAGEIE